MDREVFDTIIAILTVAVTAGTVPLIIYCEKLNGTLSEEPPADGSSGKSRKPFLKLIPGLFGVLLMIALVVYAFKYEDPFDLGLGGVMFISWLYNFCGIAAGIIILRKNRNAAARDKRIGTIGIYLHLFNISALFLGLAAYAFGQFVLIIVSAFGGGWGAR